MERRADVDTVVGKERRLLGQLPEIGIASAGVDTNVREVAGDDGEAGLAGESGRVDHAGQPDVVHPHLEGVARQGSGLAPAATGRRSMPTASSCTAARLGGLVPGSTV